MKNHFEDKNFLDKAIQRFIRPWRLNYNQSDLGYKYNQINDVLITRQDFQITNNRNLIMKCSYYTSKDKIIKKIIIFLHGNSGSRLDGKIISVPILLNNYSTKKLQGLFTFDFCGCGISQGNFITLGINQSNDLETVYYYVKQKLGYQQIYLWGRRQIHLISMGAVTAIKFCQQFSHCSVKGIIADSPFKNLRQLSIELIQDKIFLPKLFLSPIVSFIFNKINNQYGIDLQKCEIQKKLKNLKIPTVIITSKFDTLVSHKHSEYIYQAIKTKKKIIYVQGDHNENRKKQTIQQIFSFFNKPNIIQIKLKQRCLSNYLIQKNYDNNSIKRSISKHAQKTEKSLFYNFKKKQFNKYKFAPSMRQKFSLRPTSKININPTFIQQITKQIQQKDQFSSPQFTQKLLPSESSNNSSLSQSTTIPFKLSNMMKSIQQMNSRKILSQNIHNKHNINNNHNFHVHKHNKLNNQYFYFNHNNHNIHNRQNNNNYKIHHATNNKIFKPVKNLYKFNSIRKSLKSTQLYQNKFNNSNQDLLQQERKIFNSFSQKNVAYQKTLKDQNTSSQQFFDFKNQNNIDIKPQIKKIKNHYHKYNMIKSFQIDDHFQIKQKQFFNNVQHNDEFQIHQDISQRRGKYL